VGRILGIDTSVDPLVPTDNLSNTAYLGGGTQDVVILAVRRDWQLGEDDPSPRMFRFEETLGGQLTVKLVVADYSAFTAGWHPEGTVVLAGSAFVPPVF
jgi:hypothetical protein